MESVRIIDLCYGLTCIDDSPDELPERQQADARFSISIAHVARRLGKANPQHNSYYIMRTEGF